MRVAPIGLMFRHDHDLLWEQGKLSALPTHRHPLGIEGAQVMALGIALASASPAFDRDKFFSELREKCHAMEYIGPLRRAANVAHPRDIGLFGNGVDAPSSVVSAIACFGLTPDSYEHTIGNAILLGGDTDTIAAMAGALSGAYLGQQAIPTHLLKNLENRYQGRSYLEQLSYQLLTAHESRVGEDGQTRDA